jgi:hypothetical protein
MKETTFILDRLLVVKLDATIWGGRKKLHKEDLILGDGSVLPPEDLASLGSKKIADPTELAVFNRLKKEAERVCLKVGTRFLGGFAVPEDFIGPIQTELERIAMGFNLARDKFLSGYDDAVTGWVAKHPEFAEAISRAVDPVETVAANLRFDYVLFRVSQPQLAEADALPEIAASLDRKVGSLSDTLFLEVAQDAADLVENSLLGRQSATRKALSPLKKMRDKLDGLAFLDHRVNRVVQTLDELLGRVPKTGPLDGAYLQEVFALALLLSDPDKTRRHGEGLAQTESDTVASGVEIQLVPQEIGRAGIDNEAPVIAETPDTSKPDGLQLAPSVPDGEAQAVASQAETDSQPVEERQPEIEPIASDSGISVSVTSEKPASDRFSLFADLDDELEEDAATELPVERAADFIPVTKPEPLPSLSTEFWF